MSIVLQGSTSGSITLQEPAVAGSTVLDLPAVSGTILTTTSPKAGNVIQVVNATYSTATSTSSTSYVDSGLTISITPSSSSSKILAIVDLSGVAKSSVDSGLYAQLVRGSTGIAEFANGWDLYTASSSNPSFLGIGSVSLNYLDSPATTSSTTYKVQIKSNGAAVTISKGPCVSSITLLEIAA